MSVITIHPITGPADLEPCAALLVDAYNGEPWNDNWTKEKALEKLMCFYQSPKFLGWMAKIDGELVGTCVGNIEPYFTGDYFYLKEMFVPVKHQRKGIGSSLLATIKPSLKSTGIDTIILFTSNAGFPYSFWEKHGFGDMEGMRMMGFGAE